MAQQQLNLLKLAGSAAQFCAGAAQVVRRDAGNADFCSVLPEHRPDNLLAQAFARDVVDDHQQFQGIYNYANQDGKWVPKIRQYSAFREGASARGVAAWFDCAEVIKTGPNAGENDIEGCLEEYDDG